jgi:hypothetical protein
VEIITIMHNNYTIKALWTYEYIYVCYIYKYILPPHEPHGPAGIAPVGAVQSVCERRGSRKGWGGLVSKVRNFRVSGIFGSQDFQKFLDFRVEEGVGG